MYCELVDLTCNLVVMLDVLFDIFCELIMYAILISYTDNTAPELLYTLPNFVYCHCPIMLPPN